MKFQQTIEIENQKIIFVNFTGKKYFTHIIVALENGVWSFVGGYAGEKKANQYSKLHKNMTIKIIEL